MIRTTVVAVLSALTLTACPAPGPWVPYVPPPRTPAPAAIPLDASQVLDAVNDVRVAHGLRRVLEDPDLYRAADRHAVDMAARGWLSPIPANHVGTDGTYPYTRIRDAGYRPNDVGENVAWCATACPVHVLVDAWLASPPHRASLLDARWTDGAVARRAGPTGTAWVLVFGF